MSFTKTQRKQLEALGKRVKDLRKSRNLTLQGLADTIDKKAQSIHRLEMGEVNAGYLYLREICYGLGIDMVKLLKDLPGEDGV